MIVNALRAVLRKGFLRVERLFDRFFGVSWNPFYNLGTLGFFFYWIVAVSGIYVYILFDTGLTEAYDSVEYMTRDQWYLGGVMRSLHRYASDGMVLAMGLHLVREFAFDRYRGARWFSWFTGVPIIWLVFASGITGYWLVWDMLAQYVAIGTTEWLDWLPFFGEPIARNFLSPDDLDDRFFTLLVFLHIAVPLILLLVMWIHLQRISRARINPARGLAVGTMAMLLVLSLVWPATSHAPADLAKVPQTLNLDWYYLFIFPLIDHWSAGPVWGAALAITVILAAIPWLPPLRRPAAAAVDLANCNGCARCAEDCPYNAITMGPRTDGRPFSHEAAVNPNLCIGCGICAGACPTSTPFRRATDLLPGIDLPDYRLRDLRARLEEKAAGLSGRGRVVIFGCDHAVQVERLDRPDVAALSLRCIGMLPPSFVDYVLSRGLADGVFLTGCREGECNARLGVDWTRARLARTRDPRLRARVPQDRLEVFWAAPDETATLEQRIAAFAARLAAMPAPEPSGRPDGRFGFASRGNDVETAAGGE